MKKKLNRQQLRKMLIKEVKREKIKNIKYVNACNVILAENKVLIENKKYLTQQEINEGLMDSLTSLGGDLLGNLLPGFIGDMKQKIVTELLQYLGLNPRKMLGRIIINIFEEIKYTEIFEYFKDWKTGCPKFVDSILRGLSDAVLEYILEKFVGVQPAANQSGIGGTVRETLTTTFNEKIIPMLSETIKSFICNLDVSGILNKIKGMASGKAKANSSSANVANTGNKQVAAVPSKANPSATLASQFGG